MTEENTTPGWKNTIIWSVLLFALTIAETVLIRSKYNGPESQFAWKLVNLFVGFITYFSWNKRLKTVPYFASGKGTPYRPSVPFLITAAIAALGGAAFMAINPKVEMSATNAWLMAVIFVYLALLLLLRRALMDIVKIASGRREGFPPRIAGGFADGLLIIAHAIILVALKVVPNAAGEAAASAAQIVPVSWYIRYAIFVAVITGVRIGWGYVPEDRLEIVREFIDFLAERKLWWMTPIFLILGLLVLLVLFTEGTGGSFPFIYAIF